MQQSHKHCLTQATYYDKAALMLASQYHCFQLMSKSVQKTLQCISLISSFFQETTWWPCMTSSISFRGVVGDYSVPHKEEKSSSLLEDILRTAEQNNTQLLWHNLRIFFSYIKFRHNSTIVIDLSYPEIYEALFEKRNWKYVYCITKEAIPPDALDPHSQEFFIIIFFVDTDFVGDKLTHRSRTSYVVILNSASIIGFPSSRVDILV